MSIDHFDNWQSDHKEYLGLGGQFSYGLGLILAGTATGTLFGWHYTVTIYAAATALSLSMLAGVFYSYREWFEPGTSVPIWFYGNRNAAYLSACWPCLIVGLVTAITLGYLNSLFKPGLAMRLAVGAAIVMTFYWLCGKLALVSAKYNVDHMNRLKTWIS
jgi:hypothetical protein